MLSQLHQVLSHERAAVLLEEPTFSQFFKSDWREPELICQGRHYGVSLRIIS
jgi:hypothetical protein